MIEKLNIQLEKLGNPMIYFCEKVSLDEAKYDKTDKVIAIGCS